MPPGGDFFRRRDERMEKERANRVPRPGDIYINRFERNNRALVGGQLLVAYYKLHADPDCNFWVVFCVEFDEGENVHQLARDIQHRWEDIDLEMSDGELEEDQIIFPGFKTHTYERQLELPPAGYTLYQPIIPALKKPDMPLL